MTIKEIDEKISELKMERRKLEDEKKKEISRICKK